MTAHQMICHLRDGFLMGTDAKPVAIVGGVVRQNLMRCVAIYLPLRWPPGIRTVPEVDQAVRGTPPADFERDLTALVAIIEQAIAAPGFFRNRCHPLFGKLSEREWMRWAYLHTDHHLRQFGC